MIEHHVHAAALRDLHGPTGHITGAVVQHVICADLQGLVAFGIGACRGQHGCADVLCELNPGHRHPRACRMDHHGLANGKAAGGEKGVTRGDPYRRESGCLLQRDVLWNPIAVRCRHQALLGIAPVEDAAQNSQLAV